MANKAIVYDGKNTEIQTWNDPNNFIHKNVGGFFMPISIPMFNNRNINVWCNENKFDSSLKKTLYLIKNDKLCDYIAGNIVFTKTNDKRDFITLTDSDIEFITLKLKGGLSVIEGDGSNILAIDLDLER